MNKANLLAALGPLAEVYQDPAVMDVLVDSPERVLVERHGCLEETGIRFDSAEALNATIQALLEEVNIPPAAESIIDTRLPDGTRMLAVLPPVAIQGPCLVLRKLVTPSMDWDKLVQLGSITPEALACLKSALQARRSILVAGNASSGKTTMMNLIAESVPPEERVVVVQTNYELQVRHPRAVFLGTGEVTGQEATHLISTAAKMRPDWLVIGELMGSEAMRAVEVLSRGHSGILNIHANSAEDSLARLETLCLMANLGLGLGEIRALITSALHMVIYQQFMPDKRRRVYQMVELRGLDNGRYVLDPLFRFNLVADNLEAAQRPSWQR